MIILRLINGQIWLYQYLHSTRTIAQHLVENGKTFIFAVKLLRYK